jgi:CoA:oxalate CoA-transferase
MVDGPFAVLETAVARYTITGTILGPLGGAHPSITPFEAFRTGDSWVIVVAGNDLLWGKLCKVLGREELIREDPIIRHRNMLVTVDQPGIGPVLITGSPIRLSETPGRIERPAPLLGQHSAEVLREVLGYNSERIETLIAGGGVINQDLMKSGF